MGFFGGGGWRDMVQVQGLEGRELGRQDGTTEKLELSSGGLALRHVYYAHGAALV